jgi:hypothetical protein
MSKLLHILVHLPSNPTPTVSPINIARGFLRFLSTLLSLPATCQRRRAASQDLFHIAYVSPAPAKRKLLP